MSIESDTNSPEWHRQFRRNLLRWYSRHQRSLPWRETLDPYAIWVSEIMLQQTQVATVIDYYKRFMDRFPTVSDLASADEELVLRMWSGLGYYRRARSLHAAAKRIEREHGGVFPREFEDVLALPGVGRYTAGAITSMAFDARRPILEANTIRLFARLSVLREDPQSPAAQKKLWQFAEAILPRSKGSGRVNQAAMELGSLVCTPVQPNCKACPVRQLCSTHRLGLQAEVPLPKTKVRPTEEIHALLIIRQGDHVLLRRNREGEWWTGLWDFPRLRLAPWTDSNLHVLRALQPGHFLVEHPQLLARLEADFRSAFDLTCVVGKMHFRLTHGVTRFRIRLHCFHAELAERVELERLPGVWQWMPLTAEPKLPLTSPASKIVRRIHAEHP